MTKEAHFRLLEEIRTALPGDTIPSPERLTRHLAERLAEVGKAAFSEFSQLQQAASKVWGPSETAHFGQILRAHRVGEKPVRQSRWDRAERNLDRLPPNWREPLAAHLRASQKGVRLRRDRIWSAAFARSVVSALAQWAVFAEGNSLPLLPDGQSFDAFARDRLAGSPSRKGATSRSIADYLERILTGLAVIAPDFASPACIFVCRDWRERGRAGGTPSKTGAQLVGASAIYGLGFELMMTARESRLRGTEAARSYRNGLLLAMGAALPQRARALSCLAFGTSLRLAGPDLIEISIPGAMLKLPEARKNGAPHEQVVRNKRLASALAEYQREFRPIFDDGDWLFPSMLRRGEAISEAQIGRLARDLTFRAFGVRISIHRIRDNVATEASEELDSPLAASVLLQHRSSQTAARHYDHSTGLRSTKEFGEFIAAKRRSCVALDL